ncbi:MAG: hypothetical protein ACRDJC_13230 [Thermomicrobiales bacterium]
MTQQHWFDEISKAALQATTRRQIARSFAALLPSLLFSGEAGNAANQKKGGKKKKRKKGNGAGKPGPTGPPGGVDECVDLTPEWPDSPELVREWQRDCRELRAQCPDDFCIYVLDWDAPENSRIVTCCPSPKECCADGCFDTRHDRDHCGDCDTHCGAGEVCRDGDCKDAACYEPGGSCPPGQVCYDGKCGCGGYNYCLHRDLGWICFSGDCSLVA